MTSDIVLTVVMRWVHILSAIVAVGGMLFIRVVLMPAVRESLTEEQHAVLRDRVMARWRRIIAVTIGLLLLTGIYNFVVLSVPKGKEASSYHLIFGIKFILAFAVFFLASALTGRSPALAGIRAKAGFWLTLNATLAIIVVLLATVLSRY